MKGLFSQLTIQLTWNKTKTKSSIIINKFIKRDFVNKHEHLLLLGLLFAFFGAVESCTSLTIVFYGQLRNICFSGEVSNLIMDVEALQQNNICLLVAELTNVVLLIGHLSKDEVQGHFKKKTSV